MKLKQKLPNNVLFYNKLRLQTIPNSSGVSSAMWAPIK